MILESALMFFIITPASRGHVEGSVDNGRVFVAVPCSQVKETLVGHDVLLSFVGEPTTELAKGVKYYCPMQGMTSVRFVSKP